MIPALQRLLTLALASLALSSHAGTATTPAAPAGVGCSEPARDDVRASVLRVANENGSNVVIMDSCAA